ncbi:MAG: molybdopterin-dependent oxidoreductase [Chloroflexota bacterium]|nr:molybdopterin-dependent oxidoreductase [Chloroflexota bacterium]
MKPRVVDWLLFLLVMFEVVTGFVSFTIGVVDKRWLFVLHGIIGLALVLLLTWKLQRVARRLTNPARWDSATSASVAALAAVLLTFLTGLVWTSFQWPLGYPNGMILHVSFGLLLLVFMIFHMLRRFKPLRWQDVRGRRNALRFLAMIATGGVVWQAQQTLNGVVAAPGANRRFTGSRETGTDQGNNFPITMWMLDNPAPFDVTRHPLRIYGAVEQALTLPYADILTASTHEVRATLDCTGGWYTTQEWRGVPLDWLLNQVKPSAAAVAVSFVSTTGYRWSLPLAEAETVLLATHVGGELLDHGHGAPLRLVAPGRRGFQWVKWVTEIELLTAADYGQWLAIFTSGLGRETGNGKQETGYNR